MRVVSRLNSQALSGKSIKPVLRGKSSYYSFYGRLVYLAWRWKARQTLSEHMNLFPEMVGMNWKHLAEQYRCALCICHSTVTRHRYTWNTTS